MEVSKMTVRLHPEIGIANTRILGIDNITEEETKAVQLLNAALSSLRSFAGDFAAALILFDFAAIESEAPKKHPVFGEHPATNEVMKRWAFIAARDGAMTIFHFGQTLHAISQNLAVNSRIRAIIDPKVMKEAHKLFQKHFPKAERVRHSVAHAAEKLQSREMFEKHSFSGTHQGVNFSIAETKHLNITNALVGRSYTATWDQETLQYDLSRESADALDAIVKEVTDAIHAVPGARPRSAQSPGK